MLASDQGRASANMLIYCTNDKPVSDSPLPPKAAVKKSACMYIFSLDPSNSFESSLEFYHDFGDIVAQHSDLQAVLRPSHFIL